jgi:hypothetical protein
MQKNSRIHHRFSYLMFSSALPFSGSAEENSVTNQKGTSAMIRKQKHSFCAAIDIKKFQTAFQIG